MDDNVDAKLKTEIDKIMKGVKNTIKKIDALTPKKEEEPDQKELDIMRRHHGINQK